jgi:hypothetical protein
MISGGRLIRPEKTIDSEQLTQRGGFSASMGNASEAHRMQFNNLYQPTNE